jgi:serine/threonine-protein kinase
MGTPAYMSPEQAGGMTNMIDGRSDIYSLGVMMYQMLTGKLPFPGSSFGEVLIGHLQTPPPPPRGHNPALPEEMEAIILKALEKKQADRYQSMREYHDAILDYMNRAGVPNELPAADANEQSSPGVKMPTPGPMTNRPKSQPGAATRSGAARPGLVARTSAGKSQPGKSVPPSAPPAPAPSRTGLYIGIGVAVLAAVGVVGYIVHDQSEKAAQEVARLNKEAKEKAEQARIAAERAKQAEAEAAAAPIALAINSEPIGATVRASWKGGSASKETNFILEVPKMSAVHLVFSKANYLNYETDAVADQVKAVTAKLVLDPSKVPAQPAKVAPKPKPKPKRDDPAPDSNPDSTIPVEF